MSVVLDPYGEPVTPLAPMSPAGGTLTPSVPGNVGIGDSPYTNPSQNTTQPGKPVNIRAKTSAWYTNLIQVATYFLTDAAIHLLVYQVFAAVFLILIYSIVTDNPPQQIIVDAGKTAKNAVEAGAQAGEVLA
jgi:hypothetical protein